MNGLSRQASIITVRSKRNTYPAERTTVEHHYFRNITTSELAFRIAVDNPEPAKEMQAESQYDYHAHLKTWGMYMDFDR